MPVQLDSTCLKIGRSQISRSREENTSSATAGTDGRPWLKSRPELETKSVAKVVGATSNESFLVMWKYTVMRKFSSPD